MGDAQKRYRATPDGKRKHRENMREYMIAWRKNRKESADYDVEEERRKWREQHRKVREKAMDCLGGRQCVNCGCDDFSLLEINHTNGGGRKLQKRDRTAGFIVIFQAAEFPGTNIMFYAAFVTPYTMSRKFSA